MVSYVAVSRLFGNFLYRNTIQSLAHPWEAKVCGVFFVHNCQGVADSGGPTLAPREVGSWYKSKGAFIHLTNVLDTQYGNMPHATVSTSDIARLTRGVLL